MSMQATCAVALTLLAGMELAPRLIKPSRPSKAASLFYLWKRADQPWGLRQGIPVGSGGDDQRHMVDVCSPPEKRRHMPASRRRMPSAFGVGQHRAAGGMVQFAGI